MMAITCHDFIISNNPRRLNAPWRAGSVGQ